MKALRKTPGVPGYGLPWSEAKIEYHAYRAKVMGFKKSSPHYQNTLRLSGWSRDYLDRMEREIRDEVAKDVGFYPDEYIAETTVCVGFFQERRVIPEIEEAQDEQEAWAQEMDERFMRQHNSARSIARRVKAYIDADIEGKVYLEDAERYRVLVADYPECPFMSDRVIARDAGLKKSGRIKDPRPYADILKDWERLALEEDSQ